MKKKSFFIVSGVLALFAVAVCVSIYITVTVQQKEHREYVELSENPLVFVADSVSCLGKISNRSYWVEKENNLIKFDWANKTVRMFGCNDLFFRMSNWPPALMMGSCSNKDFEEYAYQHFGVWYDPNKQYGENFSLILKHPDKDFHLFVRVFLGDANSRNGSIVTLTENFMTTYIGVFKNID